MKSNISSCYINFNAINIPSVPFENIPLEIKASDLKSFLGSQLFPNLTSIDLLFQLRKVLQKSYQVMSGEKKMFQCYCFSKHNAKKPLIDYIVTKKDNFFFFFFHSSSFFRQINNLTIICKATLICLKIDKKGPILFPKKYREILEED